MVTANGAPAHFALPVSALVNVVVVVVVVAKALTVKQAWRQSHNGRMALK